ncbi:MAG: ATP-dependent RNA helicase RhlE [Candidatus Azotimanducaceae bacterium]|jgi:ATP-dependent RNA helicase RhlE
MLAPGEQNCISVWCSGRVTAMNFQSLGLSTAIQQALGDAGYRTPTSVQEQTIPVVLQGKDVLVAAQTGTGKTAGFVAPMLDLLGAGPSPGSNQVKGLILVPTRELAVQVHQSIIAYGVHISRSSGLSSAVVFGGVKINPQMMTLRKGVHLLVATPGRLLDLYQQNAVKFDHLEILVLDEADRMLSLGFADEMNRLLGVLPRQRQTLMFSATLSAEVKQLSSRILHQPVEISINPERVAAVKVNQWLAPVDKKRKTALLLRLLAENNREQALVFVNTKKSADRLTKELSIAGLEVAAIHGDKSQAVRSRNLQAFKAGELQILVATDVASRGLDIGDLPVVINVDLPKVAEDYVHRIGRTGRANKIGEAISLVSADEFENLRNIEQLVRHVIRREVVGDFDPSDDVPVSNGVPPERKPKKPKKQKKPKI